MVKERFPNRSKWPEIFMEILRRATFEEHARFVGDDRRMDYEFIFWAIQEAESSDPRQATRWENFRTANPSRLNIRPPSWEGIANIPSEYLPSGIVWPQCR